MTKRPTRDHGKHKAFLYDDSPVDWNNCRSFRSYIPSRYQHHGLTGPPGKTTNDIRRAHSAPKPATRGLFILMQTNSVQSTLARVGVNLRAAKRSKSGRVAPCGECLLLSPAHPSLGSWERWPRNEVRLYLLWSGEVSVKYSSHLHLRTSAQSALQAGRNRLPAVDSDSMPRRSSRLNLVPSRISTSPNPPSTDIVHEYNHSTHHNPTRPNDF